MAQVITLKHDSRCRACGADLPAGRRAYWQKSHGVACLTHGPDGIAAAERPNLNASHSSATRQNGATAKTTRPASGPRRDTTEPVDQQQWAAYCDYLVACVQAQHAGSVHTLESAEGWRRVAGDDNPIASGRSCSVDLPLDVVTKSRAGETTFVYGWPVLVIPDDRGHHQLIPLFVLPVDIDTTQEVSRLVPGSEPVELNEQLRASRLEAPDVTRIEEICASLITSGSEWSDIAQAIATDIGLPCADLSEIMQPISAQAGVQNAAVLLFSREATYNRRLIGELIELRSRTDWETTVAGALFRGDAGAASPTPAADVLAPVQLNDSQYEAVQASSNRLTVVTGPPGTGKSQVVASVVATAWNAGQSVLVTSTNNGAVDVAVQRIQAIQPLLALRSGNAKHRQDLAAQAALLVNQTLVRPPGTAGALTSFQRAHGTFVELLRRESDYQRAQDRMLVALIDHEAACQALWHRGSPPRGVTEQVAQRTLRLTRKLPLGWWRRRRFTATLETLRLPRGTAPGSTRTWAEARQEEAGASLDLQAVSPVPTAEEITEAEQRWQQTSVMLLDELAADATRTGRSSLQRLATTGGRPGRGHLLTPDDIHHLRGWAVTALSLGATVPLQAGIFDLLVLDEASQCSLAHVLPAAYRAKRALVLGDPSQLTAVITLRPRHEEDIALATGNDIADLQRRSLTFRRHSAFDAIDAAAGHHTHLLTEHYRCHPAIARWFNTQFYGTTLQILTPIDVQGRRGLVAEPVRGTTQRGPQGSWVNELEASRVVDVIAGLDLDSLSLGVVTPFSAQAHAITSILQQRFDAEWFANHDVAVSTTHRFQGSERDVMVFSTVLTPGLPPNTAKWLENDRNLINVAVSRAKQLLILVGHPDAPAEHGLATLTSLWDVATAGPIDAAPAGSLHSVPEARLWAALQNAGLACTPKVLIEGYELDFAWASPSGTHINIEVDGDHHFDDHGRRVRQDQTRDRVLASIGWPTIRVPAWYAFTHPDLAVAAIQQLDRESTERGLTVHLPRKL